MSDIITTEKKNGTGVTKGKKLSTRIDLTPMVDLGFLLITFFIFATTLLQPTALKLFLPADTKNDKDLQPVKASGVLTLLLAKNDAVYYYEGKPLSDARGLKRTSFSSLRDVIINKKKHTPPKDLFIIIKPGASSSYGNAVDALDEMTINDIRRYALTDISPQEAQLITTAPVLQQHQ